MPSRNLGRQFQMLMHNIFWSSYQCVHSIVWSTGNSAFSRTGLAQHQFETRGFDPSVLCRSTWWVCRSASSKVSTFNAILWVNINFLKKISDIFGFVERQGVSSALGCRNRRITIGSVFSCCHHVDVLCFTATPPWLLNPLCCPAVLSTCLFQLSIPKIF